ncbi:splicing factor [Dimargaris cristalligena]|nr:splicing factor [Dimargaris cristalligena]
MPSGITTPIPREASPLVASDKLNVDQPASLVGLTPNQAASPPSTSPPASPHKIESSQAHSRTRSRSHSPSRSHRRSSRSDRESRRRRHRSRSPTSSSRRRRERSVSRSRSPSRRRESGRSRRHRSPSRGRSRSRSPDRNRRSHRSSRSHRRRDSREDSPVMDESQRDARTIFVMQLSGRIRRSDLYHFFAKVGRVRQAQIILDRYSGRSKGIGYVEFYDKDTVEAALQLNGEKLLGIPIIVDRSEAEKNRRLQQGPPSSTSSATRRGDPRSPTTPTGNSSINRAAMADSSGCRLYVGSISYALSEQDLRLIFEPFGPLESVTLHREPDTGHSKGFGFVQYHQPIHARMALEALHGFELAGRRLKVENLNQGPVPSAPSSLASTSTLPDPVSTLDSRAPTQSVSPSVRPSTTTTASPAPQSSELSLDDEKVHGTEGQDAGNQPKSPGTPPADASPHPHPGSEPSNDRLAALDLSSRQSTPAAASAPSAQVVYLQHMFDPETETEPQWVEELEEDIRDECAAFGTIQRVFINKTTKGDVYIQFENQEAADKAIQALHGRWFAGQQITATRCPLGQLERCLQS